MQEDIFVVDALQAAETVSSKGIWFEELTTRSSLSSAIYQLPNGATDPQGPHDEDEIYFVISGEAVLSFGETNLSVSAGDLIDVPAGAEHRFHTISKTLQLLAVFSPRFGTGARQ